MIIVAAILVVLTTIGLAAAIPALVHSQAPTYNVAQIYITSWSVDIEVAEVVDVQFVISLDLNDDGVFEVSRPSEVLPATYFEIAPFHVGGPINTEVDGFAFKVEAFMIVDGSPQPLVYTMDGTTPINHGVNVVDSSQAWEHSEVYSSEKGAAQCSISYVYYVN